MAGGYPTFCSMKQPESIATPLPLDGMLVHRRVIPQQYVTGTHLCTWLGERQCGAKYLV